jgi:hypothetical protein
MSKRSGMRGEGKSKRQKSEGGGGGGGGGAHPFGLGGHPHGLGPSLDGLTDEAIDNLFRHISIKELYHMSKMSRRFREKFNHFLNSPYFLARNIVDLLSIGVPGEVEVLLDSFFKRNGCTFEKTGIVYRFGEIILEDDDDDAKRRKNQFIFYNHEEIRTCNIQLNFFRDGRAYINFTHRISKALQELIRRFIFLAEHRDMAVYDE